MQPFGSIEDDKNESTTDNATDLENVFDYLQLEEPSQAFLDSPAVPAPDRKGARTLCDFVDRFVEHVGSFYEECFAASSLFQDIEKIHSHVKTVWQSYKDGKVDLMTAAITSNTAIDIVRRLEQDFFEQFPRFRKVDEPLLREYRRYDPNMLMLNN